MGTGPPPGCSELALVSTWLCPLSATQRAVEWGSIETNSFCRTQLMGLPRLGRGGGHSGSLVTDPAAQTCQECTTWNLPCDNPCPTSSSEHTWIHPKMTPLPPGPSPTHPQGIMADGGVSPGAGSPSRRQHSEHLYTNPLAASFSVVMMIIKS